MTPDHGFEPPKWTPECGDRENWQRFDAHYCAQCGGHQGAHPLEGRGGFFLISNIQRLKNNAFLYRKRRLSLARFGGTNYDDGRRQVWVFDLDRGGPERSITIGPNDRILIYHRGDWS